MEVSERVNTLDDILGYMKTVFGALEWERDAISKSDDTFEEKSDRLEDVIVALSVLAEDAEKYLKKLREKRIKNGELNNPMEVLIF